MAKVVPGETEVEGFRVEKVLGRGGMGAVYLAVDPNGQRAALKILTLVEERARHRFLREVRIGKEHRHPNLVKVHAGGEYQDSLFLLMEFVEGRDLGSILGERKRLPPGQVLQIARQLAGGLGVLHERGITHRDLKPENLMIRTDGVLKVMDLGLVRDPDATALTKTGSLVGTPWFMAPEQVQGAKVTPATDLFAMALLLYCCLTGRHPFRRTGESDFLAYLGRLTNAQPRPWHPEGAGGPLDRFFQRAMATDPAARYPDVAALADGFEEALRAQAGGDEDSVEKTLEMSADDSGVGTLEDLDVRADATEPLPVGEVAPVAAAPVAGAGRRRGLWIAAVVGLPLFVASLLWEGAGREVLVIREEGIRLADGRRLLVETQDPADLGMGGKPASRSEDGRFHLFTIPERPGPLEIKSRGGRLVLAKEPEAVDWAEPQVVERSFDAHGSLVLRVRRPGFGRLALRMASGARVADSSQDPGEARFRIADPSGRGFEPAELVLDVAGELLVWERFPRERSARAHVGSFLAELAGMDLPARMRVAGRGEGAARDLVEALEREGFLPRLRLVGRRLREALRDRGDDELRRTVLTQVSKLLLLDAYLVTAGGPGILGETWGRELVGAVARQDFYPRRAAAGPGRLTLKKHDDYFELADAPSIADAQDPTSLFVRAFGVDEVAPLEGLSPGEYWAGLYANEWRCGFFAEVYLNDSGPYFFHDDPRADRPALWAAYPEAAPPGNAEKRIYWLRLPAGVVAQRNSVRMVFRPWAHRESIVRPFAIASSFLLEPAR